MNKISIDSALCSGCSLCVDICPYRAIALVNGVARFVLDDCFLCTHCQAVCPENAIMVEGVTTALDLQTVEELSEVIQPGTCDSAELISLMRSRRSCRKYSKETVSLEVLKDLVKIGTTAPSGTNSQPWNFVILPARKEVLQLGQMTAEYYRKLNKMARNAMLRWLVKFLGGDSLGQYYRNYYDSVDGALKEWDEEGVDMLFHGATAAIVITGKKDGSCPAEDALLATQNILLVAHSMGLGSCLIGFVVEAVRRDKELSQKIGIPTDEGIYSVIALGYPALQYKRFAGRKAVSPRIFCMRDEELEV